MENEVKNSNLYKRLQQLRVDFAFSKNLFFAAGERICKQEKVCNLTRKVFEVISILISVSNLSSVAYYYSQKNQELSLIVIAIFSVVSIAISIYLLALQTNNFCKDYLKTADQYLTLYKKAKFIEAKVEDNIIGMLELGAEIEELMYLQSKLTNPQLTTTAKDFALAHKSIDEGSNSYTQKDYLKT